MKKRPLFFALVLMASLCTAPGMVHAQRGNNGNGPGGGNNGNGNGNGGNAPIDGGLSLLLAAGIGAGAKKAYDRKKAKQQDGAVSQ